jgi:hypothetical protein
MARLGNQQPTWEHVGEYEASAGEVACDYFSKHGARFYDSQKLEFELMLARDERGGFAAKSLCITKPRQNGKSYAARWYALWMAMVCGRHVLYSAHHSRTSRDMFKQIVDMVEADETFVQQVDSIYRAGGYEGVYFRNLGCIEFQTRTNSGGRGGTYSVIIMDEAQELTPAQQDALLPTVSAAGEIAEGHSEPQKVYIGTVPGPECQGTVFREMHDRVHAGQSDVWWLEWGATGETLEDVDVDDVDLWYACNPAMGRRMRESTVRDEHDTMTRDGFARERLGWWSPTAGRLDYVFDAQAWDACATDDEPSGDVCYGVKLSPDGSEAALSACWRGDVPHFELVDYRDARNGFGWLADWLDARSDKCAMLAVDGRNADALTSRLENYRQRQLHVMRTSDAIAAAAMMVDGVRSGTVTHYGQAELDEQAKNAVRRKVGRDAWCIGGEQSTAIESAACALWAAKNAKWKPGRKARIG